jgi:hypothetical protein
MKKACWRPAARPRIFLPEAQAPFRPCPALNAEGIIPGIFVENVGDILLLSRLLG